MHELNHDDFTIGLPADWTDDSVIVISGPLNGEHTPSITITREHLKSQLSSVDYGKAQLSFLYQELEGTDFNVIEEGNISLAGLIAYHRIYTFFVADINMRVIQMQVYVVKGIEAMTITCTDAAESFDHNKPVFLDAVRQFKWRDACTQS